MLSKAVFVCVCVCVCEREKESVCFSSLKLHIFLLVCCFSIKCILILELFLKQFLQIFSVFLPFGYYLNSYENIFAKLNSAVTLVLFYERLVSRLFFFFFTQSLNN